MNESEIYRELGRIGAEVANANLQRAELKTDVADLREKIEEVVEILTQAKGSWKTLIILGTVAATIGGLIASVMGIFF